MLHTKAMSYLFGDSTPSSLSSNFIELLRDTLSFGVDALLAEDRLRGREAEAAAARSAADGELLRLAELRSNVARAVDGSPRGNDASATSRCAAVLRGALEEAVAAHEAEVAADLAAAIAGLERAMADERAGCVRAFEALVLRHDLPGTSHGLRLVAGDPGYAVRVESVTSYGLRWRSEVRLPDGHALGHVLRVEKLLASVEIQAPETGGWLRKETRLKAQRLDRLFVTSATVSPQQVTLSLRAGADGAGAGFALSVERGAAVRVRRVAEDGVAVDVELVEGDAQRLVELAEKVRALVADVVAHRSALLEVTFDDEPLAEMNRPSLLVDRLVAAMAPTVKEIAARSLSPTELVLKRTVAGNRREELFVAKAELLAKLEPLSPAARQHFAALPLGSTPSLLPAPPASAPSSAPASTPAPRRPSARPSLTLPLEESGPTLVLEGRGTDGRAPVAEASGVLPGDGDAVSGELPEAEDDRDTQAFA